ncbi:hypothetical protein LMG24238_00042 [Paraburkholderia sediminicola]|uniref:Uncharacterized protein n=1 Tax=Paraburkholderia sediminicola TaxID=458836 RepID=A0A6J4ZNG8_9BURK|nr:hypothetical protein LMG24238_00042 [Paraburkholderia sediminicola]
MNGTKTKTKTKRFSIAGCTVALMAPGFAGAQSSVSRGFCEAFMANAALRTTVSAPTPNS